MKTLALHQPVTFAEVVGDPDVCHHLVPHDNLIHRPTGRTMKPETVDGQTMHDIAAELKSRRFVTVALEPGDACRYDLYLGLTPRNHVMVVRPLGVHWAATVVTEHVDRHEVEPLANGKPWITFLLSWWLKGLMAELQTW